MLKEKIVKADTDFKRFNLICYLKSDELKYKYISYITEEDYRVKVILTMVNDDYKEELLKNIKSIFSKSLIIASFKSDDRKKKYLDFLNGICLRNVLVSFSNDLDKINYLHLLNEEDKATVIDSFYSDDLKMEYLSFIQSEEEKIFVIAHFKLPSNMMIVLDNISDFILKLSIVNYISDEVKLELINLSRGEFRASLLASLSDFSVKLKLLDTVLSLEDKMIVLMSLPDNIKEEYISKLSYYEKMALIYSLICKDKRDYYRSLYEKKIDFDLKIDSRLLFGLEIEAEGVNEDFVRNLEYDRNGFRGGYDGTLVLGVEVKTPKLKNQDKCLNEFYYVCNMLEMSGFKTLSRTGGHIHFDSSYFSSKEEYYGLFEIWTSVEDILYVILNDVSSLPRRDVSKFASPFLKSIESQMGMVRKSFLKDDDGFVSDLHLWQNDKNNGLNLTHVKTDLNTIEFRVPNGTISFPVWMQNIKFLGRLMMVSKSLGGIYQGKTTNLDTMRLWNLKEKLKTNIPHEEKLEILLEMLFTELERDVYRKRFSVNYRLLEENDNPLKEMCFQQLSLSKKN